MKKISSVWKIIGLMTLFVALGLVMMRSMYPGDQPVPEQREGDAPVTDTERVRIVAFGDSLTAGYNVPIQEAYPAVLERSLRTRGYAVEVINAGVSGETSAGGVRRAEFIRDLDPDIVLVGLGGNDALRFLSPVELERNLTEVLSTLLAGDAPPRVLLIGMRAPGNADEAYRHAFDAVYPRLARQFTLPLVPFFLEGVALDPNYTLSDGIHPNPAGYQRIVEQTMLPRVIEMLSPSW